MTDRSWLALGDKIDPAWAPERAAAVRRALAQRQTRRRVVTRTAWVATVMGAVAFAGFIAVGPWRHPAGSTPVVSAPAVLALPTESVTVTQLSPDTALAPLPDREGRGFVLRAGGARFTVPHDSLRPFVVTARDVVIEDLGTIFTVRYVASDRLNIAVEEGRVRVRGNGTDTEVAAGAKLEVPVAPPAAEPATRTPASAPASGTASASSWRRLAERGQYEEAQRALRKAGAGAVRDDTAELLLAADAARLSGHPAEAVPYLERIVRGHARDPRAGLAAFTLGRVLLDELGRPREAIEAFARARAAAGPLAEDALAREVEAVSRAGDVARCRELALLYQRLYPNGRRAKAVSRFGGLD